MSTIMLPMASVMLVVAPLSPRLVERVGTKLVVGTGLVFASAGLFVAHHPRAFDEFLEPVERLPVDAGWKVTLVDGAPADRDRARATLTTLRADMLVNFAGFFPDGTALAVVRLPDPAAAVATLTAAGGWDRARLTAHPWSQTL